MTPVMLIALTVGAPVVLFTLLRVNAAVTFLSLCLGSVLVNLVGGDAASTMGFFSPRLASNPFVLPLALLVLPAVLTTIFMVRSVKKGLLLLLNILPAAAFGIVGLLLAVPLCSAGVRGSITRAPVWHTLVRLQTMVVILSAAVSLFFLWTQRSSRVLGNEKHKKLH